MIFPFLYHLFVIEQFVLKINKKINKTTIKLSDLQWFLFKNQTKKHVRLKTAHPLNQGGWVWGLCLHN